MATRKPLVLVGGDLRELPSGDTVGAGALSSTTTSVDVAGAAAPTVGQVLTATAGNTANWQSPTTGNVTSVNGLSGVVSLPDSVALSIIFGS